MPLCDGVPVEQEAIDSHQMNIDPNLHSKTASFFLTRELLLTINIHFCDSTSFYAHILFADWRTVPFYGSHEEFGGQSSLETPLINSGGLRDLVSLVRWP
jgi:hypothetical protein